MSGQFNIISLADKLLERGEASFALCPDCDDQSVFVPVVRKNKSGAFITALLCCGPQCEGEAIFIPVNNGYLEDPEDYSS